MAKYLVTGGSGFVGAEIAAALAGRGDEVVAFDLRTSPRIETLTAQNRNVSFVSGEIIEWPGITSLLQDIRPRAVIHCAAIVGVRASLEVPMQTMRVNVEGSLNVLEAMRLFGVSRIIHLSSEEIYGHFQHDVVTEDHPQNPLMA
jgi:UDP-glucose 4-epimerase